MYSRCSSSETNVIQLGKPLRLIRGQFALLGFQLSENQHAIAHHREVGEARSRPARVVGVVDEPAMQPPPFR